MYEEGRQVGHKCKTPHRRTSMNEKTSKETSKETSGDKCHTIQPSVSRAGKEISADERKPGDSAKIIRPGHATPQKRSHVQGNVVAGTQGDQTGEKRKYVVRSARSARVVLGLRVTFAQGPFERRNCRNPAPT